MVCEKLRNLQITPSASAGIRWTRYLPLLLLVALTGSSLPCHTAHSTPNHHEPEPSHIEFAGVWLELQEPLREIETRIASNPERFQRQMGEMAAAGKQIYDLEIHSEAAATAYFGIWEKSDKSHPYHLGLSREDFEKTEQELRQEHTLVDLEIYSKRDLLWIAAIWKPENQDDSYRVTLDQDWDILKGNLRDKEEGICPDGFYIADIEPYHNEYSRPKFAVICYRGSKSEKLQYGTDFGSFVRQAKILGQGRIRLVDYEIFDGLSIGVWNSGSTHDWLVATKDKAGLDEKIQILSVADSARCSTIVAPFNQGISRPASCDDPINPSCSSCKSLSLIDVEIFPEDATVFHPDPPVSDVVVVMEPPHGLLHDEPISVPPP